MHVKKHKVGNTVQMTLTNAENQKYAIFWTPRGSIQPGLNKVIDKNNLFMLRLFIESASLVEWQFLQNRGKSQHFVSDLRVRKRPQKCEPGSDKSHLFRHISGAAQELEIKKKTKCRPLSASCG